MKLAQLRLCNFQSFGDNPTTIELAAMTFLLGPNGAGKTGVLQALARMFSVDPTLRKIRRADFHIPMNESEDDIPDTRHLWIEAEFTFPELEDDDGSYATIPGNFAHMQLATDDDVPVVRFRLEATMDEDGEIEEVLNFVNEVDGDGNPSDQTRVQKQERNSIQVHYLPALRDPAEHISYAANALLGRVLRAANWQAEREKIAELTEQISETLQDNAGIAGISERLTAHWSTLHKGKFYSSPNISFARNEIDGLLRHLTVGFTPGPADPIVDFSRLSDGQKSLLYVSVVLSIQEIGRKVLAGEMDEAFDVDKLRPAIFSLVAMEEPENSLSPHYLGRVVKALTDFSTNNDAQAIVATHCPGLLRRVPPESIRYLRLDENRNTVVKSIVMPPSGSEAYKFVREGIQAFPELYFSRLVIFGEGDSEEIVLPRLLQARGILADDASVSVVPLGGRHVNHFWRLVNDLGIPHVTLLDLDLARHAGGWGRVRYVIQQLLKFSPTDGALTQAHLDGLPKWNGEIGFLNDDQKWTSYLEGRGIFFSTPLDLDFMMLLQYPEAYGIDVDDDLEEPDETTIASVLGKSHDDEDQYSEEQLSYFDQYQAKFKLGSKPAEHLKALAQLADEELIENLPPVFDRLLDMVESKLEGIPE